MEGQIQGLRSSIYWSKIFLGVLSFVTFGNRQHHLVLGAAEQPMMVMAVMA